MNVETLHKILGLLIEKGNADAEIFLAVEVDNRGEWCGAKVKDCFLNAMGNVTLSGRDTEDA